MALAESTSKKYRTQLPNIADVRGVHATVKIGSYVERGGSGAVWTKKSPPGLETFIEDIDEIGTYINTIYKIICKEEADKMLQVPAEMKLWDAISLMFWNGSNITSTHVDVRDLNWSLVMPFGHFTGGEVDLPYLNATVASKRRDLYIIYSNKVFHNVCASSPEREVYVFTNHRSIVQRFNM